jgi:hypothetical protein
VLSLILVGVSVGYLWFDLSIARRLRRALDEAPASWMDSVRSHFRVPDLAGMLAATDQPGDGAYLLRDTLEWELAYPEHAFQALTGRAEPTGADSAQWQAIRRSAHPDVWARAARMTGWEATRRLIERSDPAVDSNLLALEAISYRSERSATRGLVIRGILRLRSGDRTGAKADFAAATTLGDRLARREPSALGFYVGRSAIWAAMAGWTELAQVTGDSALERRAHSIREWALDDTESISSMLVGAPDSALTLAADSILPLGLRAEALRSVIGGWLLRPRGFLFGPPKSIVRELHRQAFSSSDPDYARLAAIAWRTAERMNALSIKELIEESSEP